MIFGNYQEVDLICDKGSTAVVYEVERISDKKRFALKLFKEKSCYLKEDYIYKRIQEHEKKENINIKELLKCYDSFEFMDDVEKKIKYCLVLELCEKKCLFLMLKECLSQNIQFPVQIQKNIIMTVLRGLLFLKMMNLSHNDVKPENIFLSKNGEFKLGDLGACDQNVGKYQLYLNGGTPRFYSPQIFLQKGFLGEKQDVFALGVTLFMIHARSYPFDNASSSDLNYQFFLNNPQQFWASKGVQDEQVIQLITRMMSYNENERASLSQVFQDAWFQNSE